jgi:hypothetical protein
VASKDDLLRALPICAIRADVGTKHSRKGGATALVDLEPAAEFEAVNAVTEEFLSRWDDARDFPELVPMCFEYIIIGIQQELREHFGPELPAIRVVVHEVLPYMVEANEINNRIAGQKVIREVLHRLEYTRSGE